MTNAKKKEQEKDLARRLARKVQQLETMMELGRVLAGISDPLEVARRLGLTLAGQLLLRSWAVVAFREGRSPLVEQRGMDAMATIGNDTSAMALQSIREWTSDEKISAFNDPSFLPEEFEALVETMDIDVKALVPLLSGSTLIGFVLLGPRPGKRSLSQDDVDFAFGLCRQAVVAFESSWQSQEATRWRLESHARQIWEKFDRFARMVFVAITRLGFETPVTLENLVIFLGKILTEVGLDTGEDQIAAATERLIAHGAVEKDAVGCLRVANPSLVALPEAAKPIAELARESMETVGAYRLEQRIGGGGMGEVFRAINAHDGSPAAVKLMYPHAQEDKDLRLRFEREGAVVASLSSPNIVRFLERGEHHGRLYLAMELIDGVSLEKILDSTGRMDPPEAIGVFRAMATALAAIHESELVHRDVKPANVMRRKDGTWVLLDLGLATGMSALTLTAGDSIVGTLPYMSPERLRGNRGDASSDVWALAVVAFEILIGRLPWQKRNDFGVVAEILESELPPLSGIENLVGKDFAGLLRRMLERRPEDRPNDAKKLLRELDQVQMVFGKTDITPERCSIGPTMDLNWDSSGTTEMKQARLKQKPPEESDD